MQNPTHTDVPSVNGLGANIGTIVAGPAARGDAAPSSSNISQEFHSLLTDLEELVKDATSLTGDELAQARLKLNARIATAKAAVEAGGNNIMQRARRTAVVTKDYVREQPWKALGASAALGFVLGRVLTRRSRSRNLMNRSTVA